jgi:hypothetical protein
VPSRNRANLCLRADVRVAVDAGRFHVWTASRMAGPSSPAWRPAPRAPTATRRAPSTAPSPIASTSGPARSPTAAVESRIRPGPTRSRRAPSPSSSDCWRPSGSRRVVSPEPARPRPRGIRSRTTGTDDQNQPRPTT